MLWSKCKAFMSEWLILYKFLYFFRGMAIASTDTLVALDFYNIWGMSYSMVGYLMSMLIVDFIGSIFWGYVADKYGYRRYILYTATLIYAVVFFISGVPKIFHIHLSSEGELAFLCVTSSVTWFFQSAIVPLTDSSVLQYIKDDLGLTENVFNHQRLFHDIGFIIGATISGYTYHAGIHQKPIYHFNAFIFTMVYFALVIAELKSYDASIPPDNNEEESVMTDNNPIRTLLTNMEFMSLLIITITNGLCVNILFIYQGIYVQGEDTDTVKASLMSALATGSEVLFYFLSEVIKKYVDIQWLLYISQSSIILRVFGYTLINDNNTIWLPYLLCLCGGFNYAFFYPTAIEIASEIAPKGSTTLALGILNGCFDGMSIMLAGIIGGSLMLINDMTIKMLFSIIAYITISITLLFLMKFVVYDKIYKRYYGKVEIEKSEIDALI